MISSSEKKERSLSSWRKNLSSRRPSKFVPDNAWLNAHDSAMVVLCSLLLFGVFNLSRVQVAAIDVYQDISFAFFPSGQKAYDYGEIHFNGADPSEYDVNRAMRYFLTAEQLDPNLPYVHHEVARIYFINGDFGDAMAQIDVQIAQEGSSTPNSYYVRGLIEGYMGDYTDAIADYQHFLQFDPSDWAGNNDYSWVLMKARDWQQAEIATSQALAYQPSNPWLLNTNATALYELGDYKDAETRALEAWIAVQNVTQQEWLEAYPGNSPTVAQEGIASFKAAVHSNLQTIVAALASSTVQSNTK